MIKENLSSITQGKKEKKRKTEKSYSYCAGDTSIKK